MDDVPVTPPESSPGDGPGDRTDHLGTLRDRVMAGEISTTEYYTACYQVVGRYVYRNSRRYLDKHSFEAEDIVQETMTKAVQRYGPLITHRAGDPAVRVGNVSGLLIAMARNLLADHNPRTEEPAPELVDDKPPRPAENAGAKKQPLSLDVIWHEDSFGTDDIVAGTVLAHDADATLAAAREQARRRLHKLAAQAKGPGACPFNMTSKLGCPHAARIFELIGELIDVDVDVAGPSARERLRDLGRQLNLSSKKNELRRELIGCFDWWSYLAFRGTAIDQPRGGGDRIREPLVGWLTAGLKPGGTWRSSACPQRGAEMILATNPEEFERLLAQLGRADVYEFLKRRAS